MMPPVTNVCKLWEEPGWNMDVLPFPGMAGGVLLLSAKAAERQLAVSATAVIIERVRFIIQFLLEWDVILF